MRFLFIKKNAVSSAIISIIKLVLFKTILNSFMFVFFCFLFDSLVK